MPKGIYVRTEAIKKKQSDAKKGNKYCLGYKNALGHRHSEEWKKDKSDQMKGNIYSIGQKFSEEEKKRRSERIVGDKNPMKKFEVRKKNSELRRGKKLNLSEEQKRRRSEARLKQVIPFRDTSIEIKLQEILKEKGIEFETHKTIFGQQDIFIEPNICIFADGDYWHNLPEAIERDKKVNKILKEKDYKSLDFGNVR